MIEIIYFFLLHGTLLYLAVYDGKHQIIQDKILIIMLPFMVLYPLLRGKLFEAVIWGLLAGLFLLLTAVATNGGIGGGDIKLLSMMALAYKSGIILIILFASLSGFIYGKIKKDEKIALVPHIFASSLAMWILKAVFLLTR